MNGVYLPIQEAKISVLDRGFLFGDGVYEVIPVYGQGIFRLSEHLQRLANSLAAIDISNPYSNREWEEIYRAVLEKNPGDGDRSLYVQVTRGTGEREHLYDGSLTPSVFVMSKPAPAKIYKTGISAITHPDIRWQYCYIKAITLLPGVMLRQLAFRTDGSQEAILIRDGMVTEGAASNVFIVRDGKVTTPAKGENILPGITRDLLVELLQSASVPCYEADITEAALMEADEIWITGSLSGIAPVVRLNGKQVGDGKPGKVWKIADRLFQEYKTAQDNSLTGSR